MQNKMNVVGYVAAPVMAVALLLGACGGGSDSNSSGSGTPPPITGYVATVPFDPIVFGKVIDANSGLPVQGASVQADGQTATTDAAGKFSFTLAVNARVIVSTSKPAYATNVAITTAAQSTRSYLTVPLLPEAATPTFDPATGGTATVPGSTARIVLAPASLVRVDGAAITGNVTVRVTPINPSINPAYMPGNFSADRPGAGGAPSTPAWIESFGAATVTVVDASGAAVAIAPGMTASIRIPVGTRSAARPATVPLFYFDVPTGKWVEQGTATLGGTAPDQYYEGTVSRVGTWNADQYYDTVAVTGCLQDDRGRRVAGGRVFTDGIDYSGTAEARTDAQGNFSVPLKTSAQAILTAQNGIRQSNSKTVGPATSNVAAGACLVVGSDVNGLNVRLTWGLGPLDVDSHLYLPDGTHVSYLNKGSLGAAPYANLDIDDVTSYGPEIVTVRRLMVGTYRYSLHNYSATFTPGMIGSPTRVELTAADDLTAYSPPAGELNNRWWNVFEFTVDAQCGITVTPTNTWSANAPVTGATSTPVYCVVPPATPASAP
ncbi:MAG: hypothetical protein RLZZ618_4012 [Pseudomonadota bacterium]